MMQDDMKKQLELMLEIEQLDQKIREMNLDKPVSPIELKLEEVRLKRDGRTAAGKRRAAKNRARKLTLARTKRYHQRQNVKRWEAAAEGDWWPVVRTTWRKRKLAVTLTEAEWNVYVSEHIPEGEVIQVVRHDPSKGISLDNIYVVGSNGAVLFSGENISSVFQ